MKKRSRSQGWRQPRSVQYFFIFVALFAVAIPSAHYYLRRTGAAAHTMSVEAENGQPAGNASTQTAQAASGGQAVRFSGGSNTGSCIAPAGLKPTDLDASHGGTDQIPAWRHTLGARATIYFDTSALNSEYSGYIQDGANVWNASPCLDVRVVSSCPASSNCVKALVDTSSGADYDGVFEGNGNRAYTYLTDGTITMVTSILDGEPVKYRRMVVTHEMGHAVSLGHRLTVNDIMYWASEEDVPLKADATALNNILAIYGAKSDATTTPMSAVNVQSADRQTRRYY